MIKEIIKNKIGEIKNSMLKLSRYRLNEIEKKIKTKFCFYKGIIGELKYFTPVKGNLCSSITFNRLPVIYNNKDIKFFSVLTDKIYFGGENNYITIIKNKWEYIYILRKDFIINTYQILESKVLGINFILLIIKILSTKLLTILVNGAYKYNINIILELTNYKDILRSIRIIKNNKQIFIILGFNNRNLKYFNFNKGKIYNLIIKNQLLLYKYNIAIESGINKNNLNRYLKININYFLIGEYLIKCSI